MSVAVILGSAFWQSTLNGDSLELHNISTALGDVPLFRYPSQDHDAWILFRHGVPHRYLPNQIPYRAHALALREVGCKALLVTSSVGILDAEIPLDTPLLVSDLLMLENRLPCGRTCTIYQEEEEDQGHLVLDEGLFSHALADQLEEIAQSIGITIPQRVAFAYAGGPRTKTAAENHYWGLVGAQVNSMTLGPEIVLANELEIPSAGLVIGHKYSHPDIIERIKHQEITEALDTGRQGFEQIVAAFLERGQGVPFKNRLYRYSKEYAHGSYSRSSISDTALP